jgi:hypothetical protein
MVFENQERAILSWTGLKSVTYDVEATTNLLSSSSWKQIASLNYDGSFAGMLQYTNSEAPPARERYFRVKASK